MNSPCKDCDTNSDECIEHRPKCGKDVEFCCHCRVGFLWDKLPDENVITYTEMHGFSYGPGEIIPTAWICPECGTKNRL